MTKRKYTVRDITQLENPSPVVLRGLQDKISAGAEMKTAIKRYFKYHSIPECSHTKALKKAMEEWCNV